MKKLFSIILITVALTCMSACGDKKTNNSKTKNDDKPITTSQNATDTQNDTTTKPADTEKPAVTTTVQATKSINTVSDFMTVLKSKIQVSAQIQKAADMIGADDGAGFTCNDKTFEIYLFSDQSKISAAKTGTFSFTIEGFGDFTMKSQVNGNFVLLYDEADDSVVKAFLEVK